MNKIKFKKKTTETKETTDGKKFEVTNTYDEKGKPKETTVREIPKIKFTKKQEGAGMDD